MPKLKEQSSLMKMFFPISTRSFTQKFHSEGRSQYDLHVQLKKLQESLSSLIRELSEDPLKPNDLKAIIYRIEQIEHFGEKVDKCKEVIRQNDEKCFTKSGKVQSGYECACSFNEKCYSDITSLKNKIVDALSRMHSQKEKHIQMYPSTKQSSTSKKKKAKENRAKSNKRRLERQEENCRFLPEDLVLHFSQLFLVSLKMYIITWITNPNILMLNLSLFQQLHATMETLLWWPIDAIVFFSFI
jgi:hypothetical protein